MSTSIRHRRATAKKIEIESLEDRRMLAAFGTPWPDARSLTVSFPADDVPIGSYSNDLHQTLDAVTDRDNWQELALRAYQTWAVHADINVGLRNDYDNDFGAPGLSVNDPRFGDFRIGAFPQVGVLANSVPFQAIAGTYSGDLLLNSNEVFSFHDWANSVPPDPSSEVAGQRDIFSLLLHESGNTLGLEDTTSDWTVMFRQYTTAKGVLTQDDIDSIQALYGARTDPYETISNDQLHLATLIPTPVGFQPDADVISVRGSLQNSADVDHYEITPVTGKDDLTIRLKASGISLLKSRIEVLDAAGQVIATTHTDSVFANDNVIQITGLQNHAAIYLKVTAVDTDVFSVGDYQLDVDYRPAATQAADPTAGAHDSGVDALFTNFALADEEQGTSEAVGTAVTLPSAAGFAPQTRYEIVSSVSSLSDVDYWKATAPADAAGRLVINVAGVGLEQPQLRVRVVDATGQPVGASGRLAADGTWSLEVAQPVAGLDYFVRVSVDPNSAVSVGNYVASAEFTATDSQMNALVSGQVSSSVDEFTRWTAGKSKLYRFDLNAQGNTGEGVQLTIYDAHTREVKMIAATPAGVTRSAFAWLSEGDYILRFTALSQTGADVNNVQYSLMCDGISDDQDPDNVEPEDEPDYDPYAYYYDYEPPPEPEYTEDPPPVDPSQGYAYSYYYYLP